MARYNWRISCDIQNKNLPHKKYNIDEREKSAYLIYGHTHLYLYQEKLESSCLLLSNVFIFAQNQHCTHKNQESYHLCKRVELYKLKYYFFFFFKHWFLFPFVRAPEAVLCWPCQGQAAQAGTIQVICSTCGSFPFDYHIYVSHPQ